ncbi:hypothetical protein NUW54_g11080 [Trametes sanguinea]|uniref:Uncharacterized protein n=1 Tax=Trametes sanguinea TaxID=158606 RepID=A0ACC1NMX3_9APHY|nr:hypothetical protein NUW54_g11080 [Trametes sanguinea]
MASQEPTVPALKIGDLRDVFLKSCKRQSPLYARRLSTISLPVAVDAQLLSHLQLHAGPVVLAAACTSRSRGLEKAVTLAAHYHWGAEVVSIFTPILVQTQFLT